MQQNTQKIKGPKIIAVVNQKGGSGKTTTAINIATGYAREFPGSKVLIIDFDPQANTTIATLGVRAAVGPPDPKFPTVYEVLKEEVLPRNAIRSMTIAGTKIALDIMPAHLQLSRVEQELISEYARERRLRTVMSPIVGNYDLIVIDCPPTLGLLTINALSFATQVMVPVDPGLFPLVGLKMLEDTVRMIQRADNPKLKIRYVVPTLQDATLVSRQTIDQLNQRYDALVTPPIPRRTIVGESHARGVDVEALNPESPVATAYRQLVYIIRDSDDDIEDVNNG